MYGKIVNGSLVQVSENMTWVGVATSGAIYPGGLPEGVEGANIPGAWLQNEAKRSAYGIFPVVFTGAEPGDPVRFDNGQAEPALVGDEIVIERTSTPKADAAVLAVLKPQKRVEVSRQLATAYSEGYSHDFGTIPAICEDGTAMSAGVQVLQTRDMEDRTNWIILESAVNDLLALGAGTVEVTFRTEENCLIAMPAADAKAVLVAMKQSGAAKLAHSWALKNAIEQADTLEAFDAIDVTSGWPA